MNENEALLLPSQPQQAPPAVPDLKLQRAAFYERVTCGKGLLTALLSLAAGLLFAENILFAPSLAAGVTLWVLFFEVLLYGCFYGKEKKIDRRARLVAMPVCLLAFSFLLHSNPSTQWIPLLMLFALLLVQVVLASSDELKSIFSLDLLVKTAQAFGGSFRSLGAPFQTLQVLKKDKSGVAGKAGGILVGVLCAVPVGMLLLGQFMGADELFLNALRSLVFEQLRFNPLKAFLVALFGGVAGLLLGAGLLGLRYGQRASKAQPALKGLISATVTGAFLTVITLLTVIFVCFQFQYLFGGAVGSALAAGFSYADYARSGFFELCKASLLLLSVTVVVLTLTKRTGAGTLSLYVRLMITLLCLCDGVMLASALKRMLLYVEQYGLSIKRLLTLWMMAVIGICLLGVILKCLRDSQNLFRWLGVTAIVGVCILSLANTERLVVRYNVDASLREGTVEKLDTAYLSSLSYTIIPELLRLAPLLPEPKIELLLANPSREISENSILGFTLDKMEAGQMKTEFYKNLGKNSLVAQNNA